MNHLLIEEVRVLVRNFINSVKHFIEIVKNKRHNKSMFYYFSFTFIIIMYFIFFNANGILADSSPIMNTNLGTEVDVGSTKLYVTKCEYDRDKNFMEVELNYSDSSDNIQSQLNFSAIAKVNTNKKLNVKTMITTDDTYIIHIENVPKDYEAIALKVSQNSNDNISPVTMDNDDFSLSNFTNSTNTENSNNGFPNDTAKIYFDNRKVNINNNIKVETQKNYIVDITKTQISNIENNIKTINTNMKYNNNLVDTANDDINNLNWQYQYEIQQVQNETTLKINNYKSNISNIKQQNSNLENTETSLEQEINELDKKINDITKKPDLKKKVIIKKSSKKVKPISNKPAKKVKAIAKK